MASLLVKLDPAMYQKYLTSENGRIVLYVELKKALYGTHQVALLFWKNLTKTIEEWGLQLIRTIGVWQTKILMVSNVLFYGTLIIFRYHTPTQNL